MISFDKLGVAPSTGPAAPSRALSQAPRGSGQFPAIKIPSGPPMLFNDAAPLAAVPAQLPTGLITSVLTAEIQCDEEDQSGLDYAMADELFMKLAGPGRAPEL